ncbi:hypothetical protein [Streptomyces sp. NPDC058621]|uniref:hypothetical protein n=1 Tax=Streptomyces sp. NPDC058621 TaxID=3346561 RepID=UPI003664BC2D
MYSLTPGYRIPAVQRGLSSAETTLSKINAGVGGALAMSALLTPPPFWTFGAVAGAAVLLNLAPGPRSIARWATVGYRRITERTAPASLVGRPGATMTWALYPDHGTMQDPRRREEFHAALGRALTYAGGQARTAGIQVHVTHHAAVDAYTTHTQTISVHVPRGLVGSPDRLLGTLAGEFGALGALTPIEPDPVPDVIERGPGWVALDGGRYATTARITGWPDETDGTLMTRMLLGQSTDRSMAVLYRPLTAGQSRRSVRWQDAALGAWTADKIKLETESHAGDSRRGAVVQGDALVDVDAYLTVWGSDPEDVTDARWKAALAADRHRIQLDWLTGQQHRAHVMTTAHGASTTKGAIL